MAILSRPPFGRVDGGYMEVLLDQIERELRLRPAVSERDNVLYLSDEQPVSLISPNGHVYGLSVDDTGNLVVTEVTL